VSSWIYIFGALTLAAFLVVLLSGAVIAVDGPGWWHVSRAGLFVNSLHLWSTELFFFFMVIHLWAKFFMAACRGRRRATWVTGVVAFMVSVGTAFTGYLSQQNFDSEWISTQAKDGINATGAGAFWNVLDFGQMLLWHVLLLPLALAVFIAVHVLLVRRRGVVPPFADAGIKAPRHEWDSAFGNAAANASFSGGLHMKAGDFGPVATMMTGLLSMARSGALDGALLATPQLYGTDYTKPLLFIAGGSTSKIWLPPATSRATSGE
jgi:hypothetical protein